MSIPHPDAAMLRAFLAGEVGERTAVWLAEHLDGCPVCAAEAARLDSLAVVWTACERVSPPPELARDALARAAAPGPEAAAPAFDRWIGWGVGVALLGAAGALASSVEALVPGRLLSTEVLGTIAAAATADAGRAAALAAFTVLGGVGALAVARLRTADADEVDA